QAVDEPRVGDDAQPRRRVDAGDPERAEVAPAHPAAARRLHHGALHCLDGALVAAVAAAPEALGELEDAISTATCLEPTLDAHCTDSLLRQPVRQGLLEVPLVAARQDQRIAETVLALAVLAQRQVVPAAGLAR